MIAASAVDGHALLQVVWVSLAAGVGLAAVFSLCISGAVRSGQERRGGRPGPATVYAALAVACGLLCAGAVALAVVIMLNKS